MDDIGDYIYLIVIAIAGLSSLLKRKKKPQGVERDLMPEMSDFPDLDDVIPEVREVIVPREVVNEIKPEKASLTIPTYENQTDFTRMRSKMALKNHIHKIFEEPEPEDNKNVIIALESSDDAARAFVYSEIFNRKY